MNLPPIVVGLRGALRALRRALAETIIPAVAALFCGGIIFWSFSVVQAQGPKTYYLDCTAGNDANPGTSTAQAWKSITKANSAALQPGDNLLLKRGCAWQGPLKAAWQGTAAQPIVIGAYGSGDLPKIQNSYSSNVQITGSYQVIEYLETTLTTPPSPDPSCSNQPVGWKLGFSFSAGSTYNTVQYSKANKLAIGVYLDYTSHHNKVLYNELTDNSVVWKMDSTQALGAMGVLLHGDYQEIAYNTFRDNGTLCTYNGTVESNSIELHGASYANIHHNKSYNDRVFSELGSSATYASTDNTYAYNLHVAGPLQSQVGSRFIVTRGLGHANGPVWRTKAYNNTIYHTGSTSKGITCQDCGPEVLIVKNNIFWVDREPISSDGPFIEEYNLYWSTAGNPLLNFVQSASSRVANPSFVNVGANDFHLQSTSLALNTGTTESVTAGYTADLDHLAVPQSAAVDLGAFELAGTPPSETVPTPSPTPVAPTMEPCTVSVNDGAIYTGNRSVQVKANVPGAVQMMVSNDAGFAGATWQPYQPQFDWTLPDTGDRIATLLVYARFGDAATGLLCGGSQIGDDIIYDPVPPTVAVSLAGAAAAAAEPGADHAVTLFDLAIEASDQENGSGVERMQISLDDSFSDPTWQPFSPIVTADMRPGQTVYVRVQDGSGNISQAASITAPGVVSLPYRIYIPQVLR